MGSHYDFNEHLHFKESKQGLYTSCVFVSLQMANVTPEYVAEIVDKFEVSDENKQRGVMGIEGKSLSFFCRNFIFIPPTPQVVLFFSFSSVILPLFPSLQQSWHTISLQMTLLLCLIVHPPLQTDLMIRYLLFLPF